MKITPTEAIQRLTATSGPRQVKSSVPVEFIRSVGVSDDNIYLFRQGVNGIIMPADDQLQAVIGYTDEADFTQELPPNLEQWLECYADEVEWWQAVGSNIEASEDLPTADGEKASIACLIQTKWGQGAPYNDNLIFNGTRCLVGCNATAIAQIMYFWGKKGYHRGSTATSAYTTATNKYKVEALEPLISFDYKHLTKGKPTTAEGKAAVAQLCEYVSKAISSDYAAGWTSAYPARTPPILMGTFRLGSKIKCIRATTLGEPGFERNVYAELKKGRPVMMAGWNSKGGHIFICDGYNASSDKYHFNWGWNGSYDGYYAMSALNPTSTNTYNSTKIAIVGIRPEYILGDANRDGIINVTDAMTIFRDASEGNFNESSDINSDGKVTVADGMKIINQILGKEDL